MASPSRWKWGKRERTPSAFDSGVRRTVERSRCRRGRAFPVRRPRATEWRSGRGVWVDRVPRGELPAVSPATGFGVTLEGFIRIPRGGIYTFFLTSDDGSSLELDGDSVVHNDGYHGTTEKSGQAALHRVWHPLKVRYFQGGGDAALKLEMEGPRTSRREVPAHWLARRPPAEEREEPGK